MGLNSAALVQRDLLLLEMAAEDLRYSFEKCMHIGNNSECSPEELESFEALACRFARMSDALILRVFRTIGFLDKESEGSVRDRINRAEKKGLIESAAVFVEIRMLRNDIAYEYLREAIQELYVNVLSLTPALLDSVERVKKYCEKF